MEDMIGAELLIAMLLQVSAGEITSMKGFFNFCTHYDQLFCRAKGLLEWQQITQYKQFY